MTKIKSVLQAIGIISKEVRKMADKTGGGNAIGICVECDREVSYAGAYFCEDCAPEFYNERKDEREGD